MASGSGFIRDGVAMKRPMRPTDLDSNSSEVPTCLKNLVRTTVRNFYSREHSLIVDLLVRNTIMKEDDLCERLRFEKKQLRQYLHTLKIDQFIKSKLQLETDADGKTAKIIHYFIDYKLFVNVVKYRLDQMQRRLESEQRQTSSRALFKCINCNSSYTDLEVDRLFDFALGKLVCVYCRAYVQEEEDNAQRSDARALVAKFHQQVRYPLDTMLLDCDRVHLSSSILEPEIRALEPLPGQSADGVDQQAAPDRNSTGLGWGNESKLHASSVPTESTVTIVLGGNLNSNATIAKERPVWMSESTINAGHGAGLGELDRGGGGGVIGSSFAGGDSITQTLAPGRVPMALHSADQTDASSGTGGTSSSGQSGAGGSTSASSGSIMQLLMVHERRGLGSHGPKSSLNRITSAPGIKTATSVPPVQPSSLGGKTSNSLSGLDEKQRQLQQQNSLHTASVSKPDVDESRNSSTSKYVVVVGGKPMAYTEITPDMVKSLTPSERVEYIQMGKRFYNDTIFD